MRVAQLQEVDVDRGWQFMAQIYCRWFLGDEDVGLFEALSDASNALVKVVVVPALLLDKLRHIFLVFFKVIL